MRAYLMIWGATCDPDEITQRVGTLPSTTWRVGDVRHGKTGRLHEDAGWRIDAATVEATADGYVDLLLNQVWNAAAYLKTLGSSCELQINMVVHCRDTAPPISISSSNIARLAAIGAGVDIDIYC